MVELKYLVEGFLSNLSDTLTKAPLVESLFHLQSFLYTLRVLQDNQTSAKELILGSSVKVDAGQILLELFALLHNLLQLVVIALQTLDVLIEALLCLVDLWLQKRQN